MGELANVINIAVAVFTLVATFKFFNSKAVKSFVELFAGSITGFIMIIVRLGGFSFGIAAVFSIGMLVFISVGGTIILPESVKWSGDLTEGNRQSPRTLRPSLQEEWRNASPNVERWRDNINSAAKKCGVSPRLLAAIVTKESRGNPAVCSQVGACGLAQLMPATAAEMGVTDVFDPQSNLDGAACYLKRQLDNHDTLELALAAYNAGPGNVKRHGGVPPFNETRTYIRDVTQYYKDMEATQSGQDGFLWPVKGKITQFSRAGHVALDIAAPLGTPVKASHYGHVVHMGWSDKGYGKHIIIESPNKKVRTLYAHLSAYSVKLGDYVEGDDPIGRVGSTGKSTGPHLHFEIYMSGKLVDPMKWLPQN